MKVTEAGRTNTWEFTIYLGEGDERIDLTDQFGYRNGVKFRPNRIYVKMDAASPDRPSIHVSGGKLKKDGEPGKLIGYRSWTADIGAQYWNPPLWVLKHVKLARNQLALTPDVTGIGWGE